MMTVKRTLLVILITVTSLLILCQLYKIFVPTNKLNNNAKFVQLVDQYQVVKMQRILLEEQYALARTKAKVLKLAELVQKNKADDLLKIKSIREIEKSNALGSHSIALNQQEARTFEQLEAYVTSTKPSQPQALTSDEKNLLVSSEDEFTLQLMGVRDLQELTRFIKDNQLHDAQIFHTYYLNQDWYVLVAGRYKNHTEALKAMAILPDNIKELKPWIRQLSTIQKAIQLYR
jgi:septal ring-binding cell division protein DamX